MHFYIKIECTNFYKQTKNRSPVKGCLNLNVCIFQVKLNFDLTLIHLYENRVQYTSGQ